MRELAEAAETTATAERRELETAPAGSPAAALLRLQASAGNAAVTRLLARDDVDGPATAFDIETDAPGFNEKLLKRNDLLNIGFQQRVQAYLGAPIVSSWSKDTLSDLSFRISEWQAGHGQAMTGKLDDATLKAMGGAGLPLKGASTKDFVAALDKRDADDLAREKGEATKHKGASQEEQRAAIVRLAEQQVGRIHAGDRGDGRKYGWLRLQDYYQVALPTYNDAELLEGLRAAGKFAGQHYDAKAKSWSPRAGPWSWCGIFALWVVKTVTGRGSWERQPSGFQAHDDVANARPGDVIHRIDDPNNALNHHCLVHRVQGDKITTINGNGEFQQNHIRTEPLTKYDRYWDVMSTA